MHAVLLGCIKHHTELLLSNYGEPYYIGSPRCLEVINKRLLRITPPKSITRSPRSVQDRRLWKASEWRSWLVFYCLYCVDGILPKKYMVHLGLLSQSIYILLSRKITFSNIDRAQKNIDKYVKNFEKFYGSHNMFYNVHLLSHVVQGVRNWGPLWTHSAFPFENENRLILNLKTSPFEVAKQIKTRHVIFSCIKDSLVILSHKFINLNAVRKIFLRF